MMAEDVTIQTPALPVSNPSDALDDEQLFFDVLESLMVLDRNSAAVKNLTSIGVINLIEFICFFRTRGYFLDLDEDSVPTPLQFELEYFSHWLRAKFLQEGDSVLYSLEKVDYEWFARHGELNAPRLNAPNAAEQEPSVAQVKE